MPTSLRSPQLAHIGLILPLCTSSISVGFSLFQYPLFLAFLQQQSNSKDKTKSIAGKPLSRFWTPFLARAGTMVASVCLTSCASGIFTNRWLRSHQTLETTSIASWYLYGAIAAAGHLIFVPAVAGPVARMTGPGAESCEGEGEVERWNRKQMRSWLMWHTVRTVMVDLPALWCFAEGAAQSFWVI